MAITDPNLSIGEAHDYLVLNGVNWSSGYIKLLVWSGKIQSMKIYSARVIPRSALEKIVRERRKID